MRRIIAVVLAILAFSGVVLSISTTPAMAAEAYPSIIELPEGWQPEGVAAGPGPIIYAGSLANGAIYAADIRSGEGDVLVPGQAGRVAVGIYYDNRSRALFVAGGPTGMAYVYNGITGAELAAYTLNPNGGSFVNDVIVTRDAAYFSDSFRPVFYRVELGPNGAVLPGATVETIELGGEFEFIAGEFNTNGIEASRDGKQLILVHSSLGKLYRVNPSTGLAREIDLGGGSVQNGDGLRRKGDTLYVVQNFFNRIAVLDLAPDLNSAEIEGYISDPAFDIPTTVAAFGPYLYAVNARFGTPPTPQTEYTIVRVFAGPAGR